MSRTRATVLPATLCAALCALALSPPAALAAGGSCSSPAATFAALQAVAQSGGSYTLGCSLSAPAGDQLTLGAGVGFTLDLDGNSLSVVQPPAGQPALNIPAGSTMTLTDGAGGGSLTSAGEISGTLDVGSGATFSVPASSTLTIPTGGVLTLDGSATNAGTIALAGTLTGSGTLVNSGSISQASPNWSIPGAGTGVGGVHITGNAFELLFSVEFGPRPAPQWVFAPTVSGGGETLPDPPPPGYTQVWVAANAVFTVDTPLAPLAGTVAGVQVVSVSALDTAIPPTISYRVTSTARRGRAGWWVAPVTVTFYCAGAPGLALSCPPPRTLRRSGRGLQVGGTVSAANGTSASVSVPSIRLDLTRPKLSISGVRRGHTYRGRVPRARCRAHDLISGIISCRLQHRTRHAKRRTTIIYTAVARSGSGHVTRLVERVYLTRGR